MRSAGPPGRCVVTFDPDAPAGRDTRKALVLTLRNAGVPDAEGQRHVCRVWARRWLTSRRDMTEGEARSLIGRLRRRDGKGAAARALAMRAPTPPELDGATRAELAAAGEVMDAAVAAAACLTSGDEPRPAAAELPAAAIVCGPGPITEEDAATVRAFADVLTEGPAAVRAFALGDLDAEPEPEAPAPVPYEPAARTLEEIEAAAVAAVERFRARQAAGEVIEPPDPAGRPPRVVVPHTPAGRYCLARCYCRTCRQYAEQAAAAARVYAHELAAARNVDTRRGVR